MDTTAMHLETADGAPHSVREGVALLGLSLAALALSSLDQCTRGPSLTGLLLSNLRWLC